MGIQSSAEITPPFSSPMYRTGRREEHAHRALFIFIFLEQLIVTGLLDSARAFNLSAPV